MGTEAFGAARMVELATQYGRYAKRDRRITAMLHGEGLSEGGEAMEMGLRVSQTV